MYRAGQELKLFEPKRLTLYKEAEKTEGLCLLVKGGDGSSEEQYTDVSVHQMFPLSYPDSLITLCDKFGNEIGVLVEPSRLDEASRNVLHEELQMAYFIPEIQRIKLIKEEYGLTRWEVDTNRGPRTFEVRSRYDIRPMGQGRFIVRDMDSNRYDIPDINELDPVSRSLLEMEV